MLQCKGAQKYERQYDSVLRVKLLQSQSLFLGQFYVFSPLSICNTFGKILQNINTLNNTPIIYVFLMPIFHISLWVKKSNIYHPFLIRFSALALLAFGSDSSLQWRAVLYTVGYVRMSLASSSWTGGAASSCDNQSISGYFQMSSGEQNCPPLRNTALKQKN